MEWSNPSIIGSHFYCYFAGCLSFIRIATPSGWDIFGWRFGPNNIITRMKWMGRHFLRKEKLFRNLEGPSISQVQMVTSYAVMKGLGYWWNWSPCQDVSLMALGRFKLHLTVYFPTYLKAFSQNWRSLFDFQSRITPIKVSVIGARQLGVSRSFNWSYGITFPSGIPPIIPIPRWVFPLAS